MAVPAYTTDLTDIDLGQTANNAVAYGGGGAGLGTGADFAIQDTLAVDKQITNADKGILFVDNTVSLGASDHIFGWIYGATPGILDTLVNGGKVMVIGTGTSAINKYALEGSDTRPQGGNKPYAVRYSTAAPSVGSQVGSPGATPSHFGGGLNTVNTAKGANLGLDAFRYGTGAYVTAGEVASPATILGFATQDEATLNKFGIFFRFDGIYQWQGRFAIGQDATGTPTVAHYDDVESAALVVLDTPHSQTDFTQWIIDHPSTYFHCANKSFFSRGTNNPGRVVINNASATSPGWATCVWNAYGPMNGHVNVPYVGCTFNDCAAFTQNGGSLTNCKSNACAPMVVDDIDLIVGHEFTSGGTGYAVDLGTIATTRTKTWDDTAIGYAATDGTTGNETILVNVASGQTLTINVADGASIPTVHNTGAGTVSVVAGLKTFSFTLNPAITGYEWRLGLDDPASGKLYTTELAGEEVATLSAQSYSTGAATTGVLQIIAAGYVEYIETVSLGVTDVTRTINLEIESNQ